MMNVLCRQALCQLFTVYVASNMLLCALLFAPWALPRETISGLLGRWELCERGLKHWFARAASAIVDRIYFWEPDHCTEVYLIEAEARMVLYPQKPGAMP
jgi:hypothetical protein